MKFREKMSNHLTNNEQKAVFFILFIFILGFIIDVLDLKTTQKRTLKKVIIDTSTLKQLLGTDYVPRFNLLTATIEDLEYIEGIGPSTAKQIVDYQQNVGFKKIDDLLNIRGIGTTRYNNFKQFLYVGVDEIIIKGSEENESQDSLVIKRKININNATEDELMILKGIGKVKALEIIKYRNQNKFRKIEDILNVKGIGVKTFEQIKDFIIIGE